MAEISAKLVKQLRDKTGAGMGDCKKALVENDGDMNAAIEYLRIKGAASASKRAEKAANEGIIFASVSDDGKKAAIVEVNCETDFVARNDEFVKYADIVGNSLLKYEISTLDELLSSKTDDDDTVQGIHNEILSKFSEKVEIARFESFKTDGTVASYVHAGNKLAVLLEVDQNGLSDHSKSLMRDIAMQVAAMTPRFVNRDEVDQNTLQKEVEIYKQQAIDAGKKEEIAEKIAQGRLEKFFTENCLVEQAFVKDGNKTVQDVVKEMEEDSGKNLKIKRFIRYSLGEVSE